MNLLVLIFAAVAVAATVAGSVPLSSFRLATDEDRRAAVAVVLLTGWPTMWTFLLGPLLLGGVGTPLFPLAWYAPALALSILILAANLNTPGFRVDPAAMLLASLSLLSLVSVVLDPDGVSDILRWVFSFILLLAVVTKGRRVSLAAVAVGCRASLVLVTVSVLAAVLLNPDVVEACRADKCGSAGQVLTSPFAGNGNVLGLSAALLLPFALAGRNIIQAAALAAGVVATCELAGSRTAFIGVAAALGMYLALHLARGRMRASVLALGLTGAVVVSLLPAVLVYGDEAFSFRGALWNQAKSFIADRPVLGGGPTTWERFGDASVFDANYSPHNLWLDMGVSVGFWGIAVAALAVAWKIRRAAGVEREYLIVYFCSLLGISTLEALFVPYFLGITSFAAILPMLVGPGDGKGGPETPATATAGPGEPAPTKSPATIEGAK